LFFWNFRIKFVLPIYSHLSSYVCEGLFFATFLKELCFAKTLKQRLICSNYRHIDYHVILLLMVVMWLLYYLAYDEGKSNVCYVLFIKASSNLCTLCFVALGLNKLSVSRMRCFCYVKNSHQVHTCIIFMLPFQCHVVINGMLTQNIHMCWSFTK
jgi:hypothetical protein